MTESLSNISSKPLHFNLLIQNSYNCLRPAILCALPRPRQHVRIFPRLFVEHHAVRARALHLVHKPVTVCRERGACPLEHGAGHVSLEQTQIYEAEDQLRGDVENLKEKHSMSAAPDARILRIQKGKGRFSNMCEVQFPTRDITSRNNSTPGVGILGNESHDTHGDTEMLGDETANTARTPDKVAIIVWSEVF